MYCQLKKKICILSLIYVSQLAHLTVVQTWRYFPKCISDAVGIFPFLIMVKYFFSNVLFIQLSVFYLLTLYKHFFLHTFSSKNDLSKVLYVKQTEITCSVLIQGKKEIWSSVGNPNLQIRFNEAAQGQKIWKKEICRELKERTHKHNFVQSIVVLYFFCILQFKTLTCIALIL